MHTSRLMMNMVVEDVRVACSLQAYRRVRVVITLVPNRTVQEKVAGNDK